MSCADDHTGTDRVELTDAEREALAEPVYDAYRLGKYGKQEYLPMWHELDHSQPPNSVELQQVLDAVESIVAAKIAEALRDAASRLDKERNECKAHPTCHEADQMRLGWIADSYDGGVS